MTKYTELTKINKRNIKSINNKINSLKKKINNKKDEIWMIKNYDLEQETKLLNENLNDPEYSNNKQIDIDNINKKIENLNRSLSKSKNELNNLEKYKKESVKFNTDLAKRSRRSLRKPKANILKTRSKKSPIVDYNQLFRNTLNLNKKSKTKSKSKSRTKSRTKSKNRTPSRVKKIKNIIDDAFTFTPTPIKSKRRN